MHLPNESENIPLRKSLEQLGPIARASGVRIAIENTDNFTVIEQVLQEYDSEYVGLCYDSGYGNLDGIGLDLLEKLKGRLISVHIHDNDGDGDLHRLPFSGTVDWPRLATIMAESAYTKPVSIESAMRNSDIEMEVEFLNQAFEAGIRLPQLIDEEKRLNSTQ
jgi:sugar phosphate isomerase/epimerase